MAGYGRRWMAVAFVSVPEKKYTPLGKRNEQLTKTKQVHPGRKVVYLKVEINSLFDKKEKPQPEFKDLQNATPDIA